MKRMQCLLTIVLGAGLAAAASAAVPPREAERPALRLADGSDPWLRLDSGRAIPSRYLSSPDRLYAQQPLECEPTAAAVGDLDEDGMPDLVVSLVCGGSARLAIHRGNVDLLFPNSEAARARRASGEGCDAAFLPDTRVIESPVAADFIAVGDMDADGHADVVVARRGGTRIEMLAGDGAGNLRATGAFDLPGRLTAWASGDLNRRDGLPDLAVAVAGPSESQLLVLEHPGGALHATPEAFPLPAEAAAVEIAALDGDSLVDVAVAAGDRLVFIQGRDRKLSLDRRLRSRVAEAAVAERVLARPAVDLVSGRFRGDLSRDLAVLADDGSVTILVGARKPLPEWHEEVLSEVAAVPQDGLRLVRTRTSSRHPDDLLLLEPGLSDLALVMPDVSAGDGVARAARAELATDEMPVAVVPMRINGDALDDLVVLRRGDPRPAVALTTAAQSFVVNDPGDAIDENIHDGVCATASGTCTLRAAIAQGKNLDGLTGITFAVGSARLDNPVPYTDKPLTVDGTSQGLVQVTGEGAEIKFGGGDSTARGLSIGQLFAGVTHTGVPSTNNVFEGNHVGLNVTGSSFFEPGVTVATPDNLVGGTTAEARNIISSAEGWSVEVLGDETTDVRIQGNWIGTDATGLQPFGDGGVFVTGDAFGNTVGGTEPGAGNVISGSDGPGVILRWGGAGTVIQGNRIGTTPDGASALGNETGIRVWDGASQVAIGGTTPAARNLISANSSYGIVVNADGVDTVIQGNWVGVDASGANDLGNVQHGVDVNASRVQIGGAAANAGNVISGNDHGGIRITGGADAPPEDVTVQANLIGTDATGTTAIANGTEGSSTWGSGIDLFISRRALIGGTDAGAGNTISGNITDGVNLSFNAEKPSVQGNRIGTAVGGASPLGNGYHGVYCNHSGSDTSIGPDAPNIIAHNGRDGVQVGNYTTEVEIRTNRIFANGGLGIDLNGSSVQENDPGDADGGGNQGQNFPDLLSATGGTLTGTLDSSPGTDYVIDVYVNAECDPSGHGEAETWLGQVSVTTDGSGQAGFSFGYGLASGFLAATATDPDGNTSELSACLEIEADTSERTVKLTAVDTTVKAGKNAALRVEVVREDDGTVDSRFSGSVTVKMAAGSTAGVGALVVGGGQRLQQVTVPVSQGVGLLSLATPQVELTPASVITPTTVLEGTAVITAELEAGKTSTASVEVKTPLDLWIERIEVQQGARVTPNELDETFVQDRMILMRIYVRSNGEEFALYDRIEGLAVELTLRDKNGAVLLAPMRCQRSVRRTSGPFPEQYVHRRSGTFTPLELLYGVDSFNLQWLVKTDSLIVETRLAPDFADRDRSNDAKSLGPLAFALTDPVTILWSRTRFESSTTATAFPSSQGISKQMGRLFDAYPLSERRLTWLEQPNQVVSENPLTGGRVAALVRWLSAANQANVIAWVHFVDGAFISKVRDGSRAWGYAHINGHVAVVNSETALPPVENRGIATHEVGHLLGLGDTYSVKDKDGKEHGTYRPEINPRRADATNNGNRVEAGAYHFWDRVFEVDGDQYQMFDFMGNSDFCWFDKVTLRYLQDAFLPVAAGAGGSRPRLGLLSPHRAAMAAEDLVLVRGVANPDGSVELSPCYTLHAAGLRSDAGSGPYSIATLDGGGQAIDSVRFDPAFVVSNLGGEAPVPFEAALPFGAAVSKVRVERDSATLAEITVSRSTPTVKLNALPQGALSGTVQVSWSGSDGDGDSLLYSLFYSPDGAVKMPIVVETAATSAAWNVDDYPSGSAPVLVLYATDGARSSEDRSAVLSVPDRDPEVIISSPADGIRIRRGAIVLLTAEIIDPERGFMPLADVDWASSRDGALGTGVSLEVATLSLGRHTLTATFTDSAGNTATDQVTIEITDGSVCTLVCEPVVPGSVMHGVSTALDAGVVADSCAAAPRVYWSFGDTTSSDQLTPSHTWIDPGSYAWGLNAVADGVECSARGLINVTPGAETHHYLIPASAHAAGALGTQWVTDAVLHNPGNEEVWASVYFHERDQDNTQAASRSFRVPAGASTSLADIVLDQFGKASAAAALRVGATGPLVVSSRTYNDASSGTYGQYIAGFDETQAIGPGEEVRLIQLSSDASFRTNIGLASAANVSLTVEIELHDANGVLLARPTVQLKPRSYVQLNNVFAGMGDVEGGFAVLHSSTPGALYLAYASVVDNGSGDPVYVYPVASVGAGSGATCGLDTWENLNPGGAVAGTHFAGSVSNGSVHLIFGFDGAMLRSTDGDTWAPVSTGTHAYLFDGAWNGSVFVVVGENGLIMTSTNGSSWTPRASGTTNSLWGITWGGGLFVAVGDYATLLTSSNGVTWASRSNPVDPKESLWGVEWHDGRFVAVGTTASWLEAGTVITSSNGVSWTLGTLPATYGWPYRVKWLNGRWVTVGLGGYMASSPNGLTWTQRSTGDGDDLLGIVWNGETYAIPTSTRSVLTSPDLVNWTRWKIGVGSRMQTILWTGKRHVVGGMDGVLLGSVCRGDSLVVTTSANAGGLNNTRWTTDLELHNSAAQSASVEVELLKRDIPNPDPDSVSLTVNAGESLHLENPLEHLFAYSGTASLRLTPGGGELSASSRTYNTASTGTFGQFIPAVPLSSAISGTDEARLVQLSRSADHRRGYRSNIGFVNVGDGNIRVLIDLYRGDGTLLGQTDVVLRAGEHRQLTDVFAAVTSGDVDEGYAVLHADSGSARYLAYASVVDNRSGDPIYIPAQ